MTGSPPITAHLAGGGPLVVVVRHGHLEQAAGGHADTQLVLASLTLAHVVMLNHVSFNLNETICGDVLIIWQM